MLDHCEEVHTSVRKGHRNRRGEQPEKGDTVVRIKGKKFITCKACGKHLLPTDEAVYEHAAVCAKFRKAVGIDK